MHKFLESLKEGVKKLDEPITIDIWMSSSCGRTSRMFTAKINGPIPRIIRFGEWCGKQCKFSCLRLKWSITGSAEVYTFRAAYHEEMRIQEELGVLPPLYPGIEVGIDGMDLNDIIIVGSDGIPRPTPDREYE